MKNSLPELSHVFWSSAQSLAKDPLFGIPAAARDIVAKHGVNTPVVILGTSGLGGTLLNATPQNFSAIAVVDDYRQHDSEGYCGLPIISTEKFLETFRNNPEMVAINTCRKDGPKRYFDHVCRTHRIPVLNYEQAIRVLGLQGAVDFRIDDRGTHIATHADAYLALAEKLSDEYSVQTLFSVLNFHLTCDPEHYHKVERPYSTLYFRSGLFSFGHKEKMVDCGASIGESLDGLIGATQGNFEHSWLIEPDRINIETLQNLIRNKYPSYGADKISLHACGVGESPARVPFTHVGGHGGIVMPLDAPYDPDSLIDIRPIDDIVDDGPTFIKMDIEGHEMAALKGAEKTIRACKPKMAVSAYHRATDLLDISNFVLSLNGDYRIGLQHHTWDRWDTCLYFY